MAWYKRDGKYMEMSEADFDLSSYAAKGWVASDPPPAYVPPDPTAEQKKQDAMAFGAKLLFDFSLFNDARGLTAAQKYSLASSLGPIKDLLDLGDLQSVLALLPGIPIDGTLITQPIVDDFTAKITAYLGG